MKIRITSTLILLIASCLSYAELTLDDARKLALERNQDYLAEQEKVKASTSDYRTRSLI